LLGRLQRLQTTASVLHTGAHPDDEDSALVAYHARGLNARTAYLSLTRGSGGQNIIGAELSDLLGIIRTEELLQARRLDGAAQFFTRANDYGFSKRRSEAARLWDEDVLLGDMVRVLRQFRPQVVVSRWSGTPADGHGHHQFAGYLTPRAIEAAADPRRFPDQLAAGLTPWQVSKFYVEERFRDGDTADGRLLVDSGTLEPVTGRSYFQIGMQGRSQQKTQQMGSMELDGPQYSALRLVRSTVDVEAGETSVFDGLDTSLRAVADFEDEPPPALTRLLGDIEAKAAGALREYDPLAPQKIVPTLAAGLSLARQARGVVSSPQAGRLLDEKIREFADALLLASGIRVDAVADRETVVPGNNFRVAVRIFGRRSGDLEPAAIDLQLPAGFDRRAAAVDELDNERGWRRREQPSVAAYFDVAVPADAGLTEPYWLRQERTGFMYDWSGASQWATRPFARPVAVAAVRLDVAGQDVAVEREVRYRYVDRVRGEVRRRVDIVPRLSVAPRSTLEILPVARPDKHLEILVSIGNQGREAVRGSLRLELPPGWTKLAGDGQFSVDPAPANTAIAMRVRIPDDAPAGRYRIPVVASVGAVDFRKTLQTVAYPHISTHRSYVDADIAVELVDVAVAPVRVGYVMGSGDKVPEALARLGIEVTLLDDDYLATGDLARFDTIVVGIRASQTRPAFVANNGRLLAFARNGGSLIVQYQQPDYVEQGLLPYAASMGEQTIRVVDETAAVRILMPDHPVFNYPNSITAADFEGWVQERNNYNFASYDEAHYVALTESHDDGEPDSDGGMVYARLGKGHYIYTG
jgi:LmbE family N-acetylglucosaminyl deacetylase